MEKDVILNENVQIAQLPEENEECAEYGQNMVISGWGLTWGKGQNSAINRAPDVPMYLEQQCLNFSRCPVRTHPLSEKVMICVGDLDEAHNSACSGDSGGKI